jgi:hypothetical protein
MGVPVNHLDCHKSSISPAVLATQNTSTPSPLTKKKAKIDEEIVAFVRPILEEIKRTVLSSHDIIPEWECPQLIPALMPEYYKKHGEKIVNLINFFIEREEIFYLTGHAVCLLSEKRKLSHPISAQSLARAKFGKGDCQETAQLLSSKCNLLGLTTLMIGTSNNPSAISCGEASKNHVFILLGLKKADIRQIAKRGESLLTILSHIKRGVLADPFLNVLCPLKDLNTKGSDFVRYIKTINLCWINEALHIDEKHFNVVPQIEKDSESIYHLAKELQSTKKSVMPLSIEAIARYKMRKEALDLLTADILVELKSLSKKLSIHLSWKKNSELFKFWIEGSLTEVTSIKEQFQKLEMILNIKQIKTQSKEEVRYAIFLENPKLSQLRKINSSLTEPLAIAKVSCHTNSKKTSTHP